MGDAPTSATPSASAPDSEEPTSGPTETTTPDATASEPGDDPGDPGSQPPEVRSAIDDLAERTGAEPSEIGVVVYEQVTWSDGSLGCPQPGMAYTQALVEGRRLVLSAAGSEYAYHGGSDGPLTYCTMPTPPADTAERG